MNVIDVLNSPNYMAYKTVDDEQTVEFEFPDLACLETEDGCRYRNIAIITCNPNYADDVVITIDSGAKYLLSTDNVCKLLIQDGWLEE